MKTLIATAMMLGLLALVPGAQAAPVGAAPAASVTAGGLPSGVDQVHLRRYHHRHCWWRHGHRHCVWH